MTLTALDLLSRVVLATALGLAIGIERQWRSRMASLQTMGLVSMGSALFLILGVFAFDGHGDPTRVAANIVTGIGFLGGGVIMKQGLTVRGLNTAATMWATAAVGALAGAWEWRGAVTGAIIVVAGNTLLHPMASRINRRRPDHEPAPAATDYELVVEFHRDEEATMRASLVDAVDAMDFELIAVTVDGIRMSDGVELTTRMRAPAPADGELVSAVRSLSRDPRVRSVRWSAVS